MSEEDKDTIKDLESRVYNLEIALLASWALMKTELEEITSLELRDAMTSMLNELFLLNKRMGGFTLPASWRLEGELVGFNTVKADED